MFKAGDVVEVTEESDATGMLDFVKGKGYTVELYAGGMVNVVNESGKLGWYSKHHFKLKEKEEKKVETLFKEGQVVWDLRNGRGVVESVNVKDIYPVKVKFDLRDVDGYAVTDRYTADGRFVTTQTVRSLYFSEPKIEAATEPVFGPVLKEGDIVLAWDREYDEGVPFVVVVKREDENTVWSTYETGWKKSDYDFYHIGEKIVFN